MPVSLAPYQTCRFGLICEDTARCSARGVALPPVMICSPGSGRNPAGSLVRISRRWRGVAAM